MSDRTARRETSWKNYALATCVVVVGGTILGGTLCFNSAVLRPIYRHTAKHRVPVVNMGLVLFTMPVVVGFVAAYTFPFSERPRLNVSVVCAVLANLLGIGILSVTGGDPLWMVYPLYGAIAAGMGNVGRWIARSLKSR